MGSAWLAAACGGDTPDPAVPETPDSSRNAHVLAAQAVRARVHALIFMDRVRAHALAPRLASLDAFSEAFQGTDIEPVRDVDRVFIAARSARADDSAIAVAEHRLEPQRVETAMQRLIDLSGGDGRWLDDYPFRAARVIVRQRKTAILAVTPTLLVVTSPTFAKPAARLRESGGLPEPKGPEAIDAHADQPHTSLKLRGVPRVPPTVEEIDATIVLQADGSADLSIDGASKSEVSAQADAAKLTEDIEKASYVDVWFAKARMFDPVVFKAEGNMVRARRHVTQQELDMLTSLAAMMLK
jgi:hypothetical protein